MGATTNIEWTDSTWNCIRGCTRVSEGCRNCYAESIAYRFSGPGQPYEGLVRVGSDGERRREWNGQIKFVERHLLDPIKWKKPRRIFVNSTSDLFHENVTDEQLDRVFGVMWSTPRHRFQVLTKRPERMLEYVSQEKRYTARKVADASSEFVFDCDIYWPLSNVWLGISCEDQETAEKRIPLLLQTPAAKRFISAEPLLGPIDLTRIKLGSPNFLASHECTLDALSFREDGRPGLNWVIAGGESGSAARPTHPDWARRLRDQCQTAGVAFFFKQNGEWLPTRPEDPKPQGNVKCHEWNDGVTVRRVGKKVAGDWLDGRQWHEFPERK